MRCPNCGSPVTLGSDRWECTWCGDSGTLVRRKRPSSGPVSIPLKVTVTIPELPQPEWYDLDDEPEEDPADDQEDE